MSINKGLFLVLISTGISLQSAFAPAQFVKSELDKARASAQAQTQLAKKQQAFRNMAVAIVTKAALLPAAQRDQLIDAFIASMRNDLYKVPAAKVGSADSEAVDKLVGQKFDAYPQSTLGYATATGDALISVMAQFAAAKPHQSAVLDGLDRRLKYIFRIQDEVAGLFNGIQAPTPEKYADLAYNIVAKTLMGKIPLERGLYISFMINELINRLGGIAYETNDPCFGPVNFDATKNETIKKFTDANAAYPQAYGLVLRNLVLSSKDAAPYKNYVMLTTAKEMMQQWITPPPPPAATAYEKPKTCAWYEIDCWAPRLHDEAMKTLWRPAGDFFVDVGNKIKEKIVDPARKGANDIAAALYKTADLLQGIPDQIRKSTLSIRGGDMENCVNVPISDKCPEKTQKVCKKTPVPSLSAQLRDGADKMNATIANIQKSLAVVKKQWDAVKAQNLSGKPVKQLRELETILKAAFDDLQAALNGLIQCEQKPGGVLCQVQQSLRDAAVKADEGVQDINGKVGDIENKIDPLGIGRKVGVGIGVVDRIRAAAAMLNG